MTVKTGKAEQVKLRYLCLSCGLQISWNQVDRQGSMRKVGAFLLGTCYMLVIT